MMWDVCEGNAEGNSGFELEDFDGEEWGIWSRYQVTVQNDKYPISRTRWTALQEDTSLYHMKVLVEPCLIHTEVQYRCTGDETQQLGCSEALIGG